MDVFKQEKIHSAILQKFGGARQARKAAEEMSELSSKLLAWADAIEEYQSGNICKPIQDRINAKVKDIEEDELPDVLNILEQIQLMFDAVKVEQARELKINRTLNNYNITPV